MKWLAACCGIALVVLIGPAAQARTLGVVSSGDDIIEIRRLTAQEAAVFGFTDLGYRYTAAGLVGFDLFRMAGEFVVYTDTTGDASPGSELRALGRGTIVVSSWEYAALDDRELQTLGDPGVPWSYRFPPGLLLLLVVMEIWIVAPTRRSSRLGLGIGAALFVVAFILHEIGVGHASAIPLLAGLFHAGAGWLAIQRERGEADAAAVSDDVAAPVPPGAPRAALRPAEPSRMPAPDIDAGPFRMPPQQPPLLVQYPPVPRSPAAMAAKPDAPDASEVNAEEPKLLR